jgi:hypothetical protein
VTAPRLLLVLPPVLVLAAGLLMPTGLLFPDQGDLNLYLDKARAFAAGGLPYRDFPLEYPPLAIVPMVVPYLAGSVLGPVDLDGYKWLFAGWQALLLLTLGLVLAGIVRASGDADAEGPASTERRLRSMRLRLILLTAGAVLAITFRFDLFPTLLMAAALWAALAGHPGAAGLALGLGVLAKLFPVAILPALAVPWLVPLDPRGLSRLGASFGATIAFGLVPFLALAGSDDTFQFLRYNAERGLQVESIGGGLAMLLGLLTGRPVEMNFLFSSVNVEGSFASAWLALLPIATVAGFGSIALLGWRRIEAEHAADGTVRPSTVVELATLSLLMLLVTSKVFSIQYVVWLVPLAALLGGPRFWLAAALMALTIPIHPLLYEGLVNQGALPVLVLNARNALLMALLGWMVLRVARPAGLEPTTFRSAT